LIKDNKKKFVYKMGGNLLTIYLTGSGSVCDGDGTTAAGVVVVEEKEEEEEEQQHHQS
jgi:GH24 family phage-related lysozyme (muramidase)